MAAIGNAALFRVLQQRGPQGALPAYDVRQAAMHVTPTQCLLHSTLSQSSRVSRRATLLLSGRPPHRRATQLPRPWKRWSTFTLWHWYIGMADCGSSTGESLSPSTMDPHRLSGFCRSVGNAWLTFSGSESAAVQRHSLPAELSEPAALGLAACLTRLTASLHAP